MQTFIDTATQRIWAFDDDVKAVERAGIFHFEDQSGNALDTPLTLQPHDVEQPTADEMAAAKAASDWAILQASAKAALDASDITILRCYEASVPVPPAWTTYRKALRAIVSAASGDPTSGLPDKPAFPAGT